MNIGKKKKKREPPDDLCPLVTEVSIKSKQKTWNLNANGVSFSLIKSLTLYNLPITIMHVIFYVMCVCTQVMFMIK